MRIQPRKITQWNVLVTKYNDRTRGLRNDFRNFADQYNTPSVAVVTLVRTRQDESRTGMSRLYPSQPTLYIYDQVIFNLRR